MEGQMGTILNKQSRQFDPDYEDRGLHPDLEFKTAADATGYWFAAAVFFAFLAAGIIVYRTANSDVRTASIDTPAAAQTSSLDLMPIHGHIEGVDP
jgi:hypothetical protein